ncbi:MAG: cell division protein FtsQ/DivIB [Pleurocapsa sp.]
MSAFPPPQLQYKLALVKLQQHRLARLSLWRSCWIIICTMSLGLAATLPYWQIKYQSQIKINGEKLISENTIYDVLHFTYPQFIWTINGINLTQKIESIPSVEVAKVNKQLIPPQITISLQEKSPVALATFQGEIGFLDSQGTWIAEEFYSNINDSYLIPKLKVIDYKMQLRTTWRELYQLISLYPELEIDEVHWNQSNSLFLNTKIGQVFLGSELSRLEQQFKIMAKLKNLPAYLESSEINYVDLSNPDVFLIQKY